MTPDTVRLESWAAVGSLATYLGSIIGLVVWLVRMTMRRQEVVTNRYMDLLESQIKASNEVHVTSAQAVMRLAEAVNANTDELKRLTGVIAQCPSRQGG